MIKYCACGVSCYLRRFCMQYVFLPRLRAALRSFQSDYNHHPIRTAGFKSPIALHALWQLRGGLTGRIDSEPSRLIDWIPDLRAQLVQLDTQEAQVRHVPDAPSPLNRHHMRILRAEVDPLNEPTRDFGRSIFIHCRAVVATLLLDF